MPLSQHIRGTFRNVSGLLQLAVCLWHWTNLWVNIRGRLVFHTKDVGTYRKRFAVQGKSSLTSGIVKKILHCWLLSTGLRERGQENAPGSSDSFEICPTPVWIVHTKDFFLAWHSTSNSVLVQNILVITWIFLNHTHRFLSCGENGMPGPSLASCIDNHSRRSSKASSKRLINWWADTTLNMPPPDSRFDDSNRLVETFKWNAWAISKSTPPTLALSWPAISQRACKEFQ